ELGEGVLLIVRVSRLLDDGLFNIDNLLAHFLLLDSGKRVELNRGQNDGPFGREGPSEMEGITVDEFADAIAAEITPTLTHPEWRVRESSCLAFADLLSGHSTRSMIDRLPETLATVFRVQDDVKESVRKAADRAAMAIRKACLNEAGSSNPMSLLLLVDLSGQCGKQMKPFIAQVVPCLLDAISEIEPWQLNYVAARSDVRDLEDLDDARARLAGSSSLMHAVQQLLPHVGKEELEGLQGRLAEQLRNSVGVSTRTAAAQLVTHLCIQAPQLMMDCQAVCDRLRMLEIKDHIQSPIAVKLFSALRTSSLRDRNPSVRKQFSSALSYLARFSGSAQMGTLLNEARDLLIGSEEDKKIAVRNLLKSLSANAPDALTGHSAAIVPYVLMETCQEPIKGDEESRKKCAAWAELWSEMVPSTETAVRLYGEEIVEAAMEILKENQVWAVRAQAAAMLKEVVAVPGQMSAERTVTLLMSLLGFLNGRYWTGKERILQAVEKLMESSRGELNAKMDEKQIKETLDVLVREAKRRSKVQSLAGLKALAQFASTLHHTEAVEITLALLRKRVEKEEKRGFNGLSIVLPAWDRRVAELFDKERIFPIFQLDLGVLPDSSTIRQMAPTVGIWVVDLHGVDRIYLNNHEELSTGADDGGSSSEEEVGQADMSPAELSIVRNKRLAEAMGVIGVVMGAYREGDDLRPCIDFLTSTLSNPGVFYRVKQSIVTALEGLLEKPTWSGVAEWSTAAESIIAFAAEMAASQRRTAAVNALVVVRRLGELCSSGQVDLQKKGELCATLEKFDGGLPKELGVLEKMQ
uniref:Proteasome adapter and scaffold protein ECM29 HEAT-repeat domain-containing protein n=1 Tax=Pristionchus pacificus TaxID=54126 RepID=A0A8R1YHS5_PRIPA